jgi:hypothetical protein
VARRILIGLHVVLGVLAITAGQALARDPSGKPLAFEVDWLDGSPFRDYRVPGLFLTVVIGGTNLVSAALLRWRDPRGPPVSLGTGVLLLVWMAIQTAIIGFRDWTQGMWIAVFSLVTVLALREVRMREHERSEAG